MRRPGRVVDWRVGDGQNLVLFPATEIAAIDMKPKRFASIVIIALIAVFALFEVRLDFRFSLPAGREQPDPAQEARFETCYDQRDSEIHETAFGTIDNPDVQKLYIINHRKAAAEQCRAAYPEQLITVSEPLTINLVDLRFRYQ